MKAFLIGLIFLIAVAVISGVGMLLYPFLLAMVFFVRVVVGLVAAIFVIWLLGKFILFVWGKFSRS
jgi:hypothetical protein